ncbi:sugar phosphate isomerase/epimerase [Desulfopila sp. IMCC35006]|uniref:sugar phosphate isomerase/epimerase family protein n=1 Tax=Desulfopila sp. IMCC35006 TaxID=2569542 RepID=UPI0010AB731D|nr:sugar phosphate isomerase/epimerase [Desulfopila sp. IMCC35006]TKB26622.1 sugar phosphate isomerase/epimerase [Desulfopila sp. IMCC35006]
MKIGRMNNPSKSLYDETQNCGRAGFDFLDLTIEGPHAAVVDIARLQSILDSYDLAIVGHTDPCLPYAYPIQTVREGCLIELERCAKIFAALGADVMNIHPCYFCPPAMKKDVVTFNADALQPIVAMAASHGLQVVLENFRTPFDRVSTFTTLLAAVPGLQLHLDFGHAHFGRDDYELFCLELGEHIRHVHFSDNRGRSDDHMPLGVGSIDWKKAVKTLKTAGYDSTITLEVFCSDPAMQDQYLKINRHLVLELWEEL